MNSGVEQRTQLSPTVPVIITYYTSWVDSKGSLHFVEDLYGQDAKMAAKMFTDPQH
jgi:murein L,D-transpeptidase YcbB/YkuD